MDEIMPEKELPPLEEVIPGIADNLDRALTPAGGEDSATGKAVLNMAANTARR